MTDTSPYNHFSIAPSTLSNIGSVLSPAKSQFPRYDAPLSADTEEDDSTIKCICGFKHDDGSSVFCEKCETWQHTECYYYDEENERVPTKDELDRISHFCTGCRPRAIDVQAAITRQKVRIGGFDQEDRKVKKPPTKSHKKKTRAMETNGILTNGWTPDADGVHDRTSRSPQDLALIAKKPKTQHRSSQSLGLSALSHNPTSHPHKRSASALQSPTKAASKHSHNAILKENYSDAFLHLYDNDPGDQSLHTNLFSNISITQDLSTWAFDVEALSQATRGFSHADVFHRIEQPLENIIGPPPLKQSREELKVSINGRNPRWIYLTSDGSTKRNTIVGELKGKIGHMRDYISDPDNRWDWLRHPAPFVFFHPKLPIYIDTRSEGTTCRYLRRSCRPNLSMTTFLQNDSDYHFCFTAKEDIDNGAELTIGWTLDEHMRKFSSNKNDMTQDLGSDGEDYFTDWVGKVSPEFGGCACGLPESCWFVRYDPEYRIPGKGKSGQGKRKPLPNCQDSSDAEDAESTSRSNSGSRDLTPTWTQNVGPALGLDISEREKRKIALLEKNLENDKHQPAAKKKKRNSGGSSAHPPGPGVFSMDRKVHMELTNKQQPKPPFHNHTSISLPNTPGLPARPRYTDACTSGRKSGSPTAKTVNGLGRPKQNSNSVPRQRPSHPNTPTDSSPLRSTYVSTGVQTDPEAKGDWLQPAQNPVVTRKPFMSMTRRLLLRSQRDRQKLEERRRFSGGLSSQGSLEVPSSVREAGKGPEPNLDHVDMPDASQVPAPPKPDARSGHPENDVFTSAESRPPLWPSKEQDLAMNGSFGRDLRVQLPFKPTMPPDPSSSTPIAQTPLSAVPQSPYTQAPASHPSTRLPPPSSSAGIQPSPAKKKVSLSDYIKRKGSSSTEAKTGVGSPEMTHRTLKTLLPTPQENAPLEGSAIVDTPRKEDQDPLQSRDQEEMKSES